MKTYSLLLCLLAILSVSCDATQDAYSGALLAEHSLEKDPLPENTGLVNDFDNILSEAQERELAKLLQKHEAETSNQIVIVTVPTLQQYEGLEHYALDLSNTWEIGEKDLNNGVLIALYMKDRRIWIHNGDGVIHKLTDDERMEIITETMVPEFKKNNYYAGFYKGVEKIIDELK